MTVTICLTVSLTAIRVVFIKSYSTFFGIRGMCFPLLLNSHTVCVFSAVFGSRIQMHSLFCTYSAEMLPCIRSSRLRAISKPRPVREKALPHSSCAQSFFAAYEQPVQCLVFLKQHKSQLCFPPEHHSKQPVPVYRHVPLFL